MAFHLDDYLYGLINKFSFPMICLYKFFCMSLCTEHVETYKCMINRDTCNLYRGVQDSPFLNATHENLKFYVYFFWANHQNIEKLKVQMYLWLNLWQLSFILGLLLLKNKWWLFFCCSWTYWMSSYPTLILYQIFMVTLHLF